MRSASVKIVGRVVVLSESDFGAQSVHVDGKRVSHRRLGGWTAPVHTLTLTDDANDEHSVEIRFGYTGWRITKAVVHVDHQMYRVLRLSAEADGAVWCPKCSYSLIGQPVDGETVRCPECGERTTFAALGVHSAADLEPPQRLGD
jgi:DNA-directed RNA polymerase subunit RPC12/RpoP